MNLGFNPLQPQIFCSSWLAFILPELFSFLQSARKVIKNNLQLQGSRVTISKYILAIFLKLFLISVTPFAGLCRGGCCSIPTDMDGAGDGFFLSRVPLPQESSALLWERIPDWQEGLPLPMAPSVSAAFLSLSLPAKLPISSNCDGDF